MALTSGVRLLAAAERDAAAAAWRDLEARLPAHGLMVSWDWTSAWLDVWGEVIEHWFVLTEGGAALLTRGRPRWVVAPPTIHVGTAGEPPGESVFVEGNRLLAEPGAAGALAAAIASVLPELPRHGGLALDGFVPQDAEALAGACGGLPLRREPSPHMDLAAARAGGDVIEALRPSVRRRIRQSLRAFGPVEGEWARTEAQGAEILEELIALHTARWRGEGIPGAFGAPRTAAFHRALAPRWAADGRVMLFRARSGGATIGCLYGYVDGGELLFYQSGFARFGDNRLRPGLVTHVLAMQACLEAGLGVYDFLIGEDRYKTELATGRREYVWASPPPGPVRRLVRPPARAARRIATRLLGR